MAMVEIEHVVMSGASVYKKLKDAEALNRQIASIEANTSPLTACRCLLFTFSDSL